MRKYCIAHKWGRMYIHVPNIYIYTYIHIYRQFSVYTTSVGLAALVPINLEFVVHTLCNYCEMVATASGNKVSKHLEAA